MMKNVDNKRALERVKRLIRHGAKMSFAQIVALQSAGENGFRVHVTCLDSHKEAGGSRPLNRDHMSYVLSINGDDETRPSAAEKRFGETLSVLFTKRKHKSWTWHGNTRFDILDEPEEQQLTGITMVRENQRSSSIVDSWWAR